MTQGQPQLDPERLYFDKWEMYQIIRDLPVELCRVPDTRLFAQETFVDMLQRYRTLYVKPVGSWGGASIVRVDLRGDAVEWHQAGDSHRHVCSADDAWRKLHDVFSSTKTIVQQGIAVREIQGRLFDVRCHMQRDAHDNWVHAGSIARIGGIGSIVSNVELSNGTVDRIDHVICAARPRLSQKRVAELERKARAIGFDVCRRLDRYFYFEEIGVDLGMGADGRWWVFEVNTNDALGSPSIELFAKLTDQALYTSMVNRRKERNEVTFNMVLGDLFSSL